MSGALITPAQVPQNYKNTIEDLLLEILNKLPVPNGDALTVLNGKFEWITAGGGGSATDIECQGWGAIIYGDETATWQSSPQGIFNYSQSEGTINLQLGDRDRVSWGVNFLTTQGEDGDFFFSAPVIASGFSTPTWLMQNHIEVMNKENDSFLSVMQRNVSGAEARVDLKNIRNLNDPGEHIFMDYDFHGIYFTGGLGKIGTTDPAYLAIITNGIIRWSISDTGNFGPNNNNVYTIGSPAIRPSWIYTNGLSCTQIDTGGSVWKLLSRQSGAVTLDTGHYISIQVDGVTYKLLTAN
ncbi:MAG: hypothetical protein NTW16_00770 [Bacteroidetes bacterium]|nr:hypothetical protein [Bacteroidota bacterium]